MSPTDPAPRAKVPGFFRGLGEIAEFMRESALALIEVTIGRWPQPFGELRQKKAKPAREGGGLIKKIAPYPTED